MIHAQLLLSLFKHANTRISKKENITQDMRIIQLLVCNDFALEPVLQFATLSFARTVAAAAGQEYAHAANRRRH